MTGRTPNTGVYLEENRKPSCEIRISLPLKFDESIWPMIGWLAGYKSPNGIPVLIGLEDTALSNDDLKIKQKITPKMGRVVVFNGKYWHTAEQPEHSNRCIINYNII